MTPDSEPPSVPGAPHEDVERRAAIGGKHTIIGNIARAGVSTAATLVLARILEPADFGLIGMIVSVTGFFDMLKDFGLSYATVQKDRIEHAQVNVLFWINIGIGVLLTIATIVAAPLLAIAYDRSELLLLTTALAFGSILGAIPLQHEALLKRNLDFRALATTSTSSTIVSSLAAIGLAWAGMGAWALVARRLVRLAVRAFGIWMACPWRPTRPARANARELILFGGRVSGFQLTNYVERNIDNVLIGAYVGATALGFYQRAYSLFRAPLEEVNRPVATVVVSTLSRLQSAPDRYRAMYTRVTRVLMVVTIPFGMVAILTADWFVPLALGEQWREVAPIFQVLGVGLAVKPLLNTTVWLFVSQGRTQELFRWGLVATATAVVAFILGLPYGAIGVATSYTLLDLFVRAPLLLLWVGRVGPVRTRDLLACLWPAWMAAATIAAVYLLLDRQLGMLPQTARVVIGTLTSLLAAFVVLRSTRWGQAVLADIGALVAVLRSARGGGTPNFDALASAPRPGSVESV
jgi:PST family polysaccharide transporter